MVWPCQWHSNLPVPPRVHPILEAITKWGLLRPALDSRTAGIPATSLGLRTTKPPPEVYELPDTERVEIPRASLQCLIQAVCYTH